MPMTVNQILGGSAADVLRNWLPDHWDLIADEETVYTLKIVWPKFFGLTDENVHSIWAWTNMARQKYDLDFDTESGFAHRWIVEDDGRGPVTLEMRSTQNELFAQVMYDSVMEISQPEGFKVEYLKVPNNT